ncbi:MAG TPA: hypothetical protein VH186_28710 [Chloroflexia bacterium]|nr:hypothetical protein [Chloroflexia bacterium]
MYLKKFKALPFLILILVAATLILAACGDNTATSAPATTAPATSAPAATATASPTTVVATTASAPTTVPTITVVPTGAPTTAPATTGGVTTAPATNTPSSSPANVSGNPIDVSKNQYVDDRTNPLEILRSFYNAINRKEYVRAYSYWESGASKLAPYADFEKGYADTAAVELYNAAVQGGAAAGTTYYAVPVSLKSTKTDGSSQVFGGCYVLRQPNPANFGAPPFTPMSIYQASVQQVKSGGDTVAIMNQSCKDLGASTENSFTIPPVPHTDAAVAASQFLDDRSTPEQEIRSFYNALNRKEYVRAYSYWDSNVKEVGPYQQFAEGYKNTEAVTLITGKAQSDAGAGQLNYRLPVAITAKQTDGSTKKYAGCYTLKLSQPALFGQPPFIPMHIVTANIKAVAANTDPASQPGQVCS